MHLFLDMNKFVKLTSILKHHERNKDAMDRGENW